MAVHENSKYSLTFSLAFCGVMLGRKLNRRTSEPKAYSEEIRHTENSGLPMSSFMKMSLKVRSPMVVSKDHESIEPSRLSLNLTPQGHWRTGISALLIVITD